MSYTNIAPVIVRTGNSITVFMEGQVHVIGRDHANYLLVEQAIAAQDWARLPGLLTVARAVKQFVEAGTPAAAGIEVRAGIIYLDGRPFNERVSRKALALMQQQTDPTPIHRFLKKVRRNPSFTAQEELLLFCDANDFMIDTDGDIIAFKGVSRSYRDKHSGQFDNSVGQRPKMERNLVDDRREITCSNGLHFGSRKYADQFAERTMVVKVDPEHVVSIPNDYNNEKGRCCEYLVIAEIPKSAKLEVKEVYQRNDFKGLAGPDEDVQPVLEEEASEPQDSSESIDPGESGQVDPQPEIASEEASQAPQTDASEESADLVPGLGESLTYEGAAKYEGMSRDALRALAKDRGVQCRGKVKGDYIDALLQADQAGA